MPKYVVLVNWTDQGVRNVKGTVRRMDTGAEEGHEYGVRLTQEYWTVGPYDMVSVLEAPDEESAAAYLLDVCSAGNIRTTTLRAFDHEEASVIVDRLG